MQSEVSHFRLQLLKLCCILRNYMISVQKILDESAA
jgi:hypothetical protein